MDADLTGRSYIVTGANSGIGKAATLELARMGASIVLACRSPERGESARREIEGLTGNHDLEFMPLDLTSHASIRRFAKAYLATHDALNVLVNNAGIYTGRREITAEGLESTLATNHVGPFLLTNLLLERLKASAPARIVNVASEASRMGRIDFEDLNRERWSGWRAYAQSKLANLLFTRELARRLDGTGVTVNAVHPGPVRSNFARGNGGPMAVAVRLSAPFLLSPARGADTVIYLAASPVVEGVSGAYFRKRRRITPQRRALDDGTAKRLWDVTAGLAGLRGPESPT